MKKNCLLLVYISFIGISTFMSSCNPKFYAPTTAVTPLFREKGETQISGHIGGGDEIDKILQLQVASAIDSHLAVFGSLYTAQTNYEHNEPTRFAQDGAGKGSQFELALGYFSKISKKTSYEVYGGFAKGNVKNHYEKTYTSKSSGNRWYPQIITNKCLKPFVQGNIGYRSKNFDAVFNLRVGYLHLSGITETTAAIDTGYIGTPIESIEFIKANPNSFVLEPGFTLRFGKEPLKIQLHLGKSFSSNNYPIDETVLSIGLVGMINSSTSKKKILKK
jgi:hypothetical protein